MKRKAVVLLSGGLDSATVLYWAKDRGYAPHALILDYRQRHRKEIRHALRIARHAGVSHTVLTLRMPWGGSALLEKERALPSGRSAKTMAAGIPSTYVPGRNTIFLSLAMACAEATGSDAVCLGANALDYSGYPDCRPAYLSAFARMARLATKRGVEGNRLEIMAPLLRKTKAQIVRLAKRLGVPLEHTWSCYAGKARPCRVCDSCVLRAKGFKEAGVKDPAIKR